MCVGLVSLCQGKKVVLFLLLLIVSNLQVRRRCPRRRCPNPGQKVYVFLRLVITAAKKPPFKMPLKLPSSFSLFFFSLSLLFLSLFFLSFFFFSHFLPNSSFFLFLFLKNFSLVLQFSPLEHSFISLSLTFFLDFCHRCLSVTFHLSLSLYFSLSLLLFWTSLSLSSSEVLSLHKVILKTSVVCVSCLSFFFGSTSCVTSLVVYIHLTILLFKAVKWWLSSGGRKRDKLSKKQREKKRQTIKETERERERKRQTIKETERERGSKKEGPKIDDRLEKGLTLGTMWAVKRAGEGVRDFLPRIEEKSKTSRPTLSSRTTSQDDWWIEEEDLYFNWINFNPFFLGSRLRWKGELIDREREREREVEGRGLIQEKLLTWEWLWRIKLVPN